MSYLLSQRPEFLEQPNLLQETPLVVASMFGKVKSMLFLINKGANVEAIARGRTPLWIAASNGQARAVKLLIKAGAYKEAIGTYGRTPLLEAAGIFE